MKTDGHELVCHPDTPPLLAGSLAARVTLHEQWLTLRWRIEHAGKLIVPPFGGRVRANGLWQATCFELFVAPADGARYSEFNLSPSEQWAAYDFNGYREAMAERPVSRAPVCAFRPGNRFAIFDAAIPLSALPKGPARVGICAVIEEEGGVKSYWALSHPSGKPDFHHPDCFALALPAVGTA